VLKPLKVALETANLLLNQNKLRLEIIQLGERRDVLERRHLAFIMFLTGQSNAL